MIGQEAVVDRLVIALLIRGHVLLEGVPGLAKTLLVKTLAGAIDASFKRIQFTPDLLPADITGTLIFDPADRTFTPRLGPIFANLVLADEINRAPAKVQIGAAGGDAGAAGDDRRHVVPAAAIRSSSSPRRIRSSMRGRTRCPRRRSIAS